MILRLFNEFLGILLPLVAYRFLWLLTKAKDKTTLKDGAVK